MRVGDSHDTNFFFGDLYTNVHQCVCMSLSVVLPLSFKVSFASACQQQCLSICCPAPLQIPTCGLSVTYNSTVLQYNLLHVCCHLNPLPFAQTPRWRVGTAAALWPSYGLWTICEGASGALFMTMHCESRRVIPEGEGNGRVMAVERRHSLFSFCEKLCERCCTPAPLRLV